MPPRLEKSIGPARPCLRIAGFLIQSPVGLPCKLSPSGREGAPDTPSGPAEEPPRAYPSRAWTGIPDAALWLPGTAARIGTDAQLRFAPFLRLREALTLPGWIRNPVRTPCSSRHIRHHRKSEISW